MMTLFRTYCRLILPALLLMTGAAAAQDTTPPPTGPLPADPTRAVYAPSATGQAQQRTTALALPFFDDFTSPLEGTPKVQNWKPTGGALVNNRLAVIPPTRGTATLDGLRANGNRYNTSISSSFGAIDSLQSQPIDLSGLSASDNVYLSFAWQAGSIVGAPNANVSSQIVRLDLYIKSDVGDWDRAWFYTSQNRRTGFKQQVVALNQAKYLHGNFQFMFVASGSTTDNSDNWSVDYVLLNRGRTAGLTDTTFVDIATSAGLKPANPSGGLRSPLRRYTSMPVWQFNAASSLANELNPYLGVNVSNLRPGPLPLPIDALGTLRELPAATSLGSWLQASTTVTTNPRQTAVMGPASTLLPPTTPNAKILRYTLALNTQETTPLTQSNDTISRDVELNNYYAYDDGTAENLTYLPPYGSGTPSAYAYRIDLNRPDYVRGLRLYPVYPGSDVVSGNQVLDFAARTVTITVWTGTPGQAPATVVASKTATIPASASIPAGWQYYQLDFDQPVPVSGTFFVGFTQPSTNRILPYALDLNSTIPSGYLWRRNNLSAWDTIPFPQRRGALMMRPVMTNNVVTATASAHEAAAFSVYPNPAHGTVTVAGPAFARAAVLDALGRTVWVQPAAQAGQAALPLPTLPPGVYTVRLTLTDGNTIGKRLMLE